ncbi:phosphoribosylanthranilate isomerase [Aestuariivirga sp.]|jgi:phosphoribosylanthranilate isomerase|uniref:phosphoribosylanthranilate isomerase n=1 Tax=Aestuariivirga sp. TaxID=2650926 RepID=UPI0037846A58
MPADVKICGLSTPETVEAAIAAGADLIGLVFYPKSPRNVSLEQAAALAAQARGRAKIVSLVVDAEDATLREIAARVAPDLFQAHGSESPERVGEIARLTGKPVIKAVRVKEAVDIVAAAAYSTVASLIMYDAKAPETLGNALPGGNGHAFDWGLLDNRKRPPFMLAGGLTPANVAEAIRVTGAPIVDVSSGVESAPGVKDASLIRKFIEAAKRPR